MIPHALSCTFARTHLGLEVRLQHVQQQWAELATGGVGQTHVVNQLRSAGQGRGLKGRGGKEEGVGRRGEHCVVQHQAALA